MQRLLHKIQIIFKIQQIKQSGAFSTRDLNGSTTQTISVKVQGTNDLPIVTSNTSKLLIMRVEIMFFVTDAQFSDIDNTTFNGGSIDVEMTKLLEIT